MRALLELFRSRGRRQGIPDRLRAMLGSAAGNGLWPRKACSLKNQSLRAGFPCKRIFYIPHVENRGAAFGIFNDSPTQWKIGLLVLFSIAALVIVSALLWKSSHAMTASAIGLSLILGGAVGNLWDRLLSGRVVDFLLVYIGSYQWPAFNVADSAIVVGAGLLVFEILFTKAPEAEKTA